jgi:hypothetical protein
MRFETIFVMATIFSSSDPAPLNSVINCCTAATFSTYYCLEANCLHLETQRTALRAVRVGVRAQACEFTSKHSAQTPWKTPSLLLVTSPHRENSFLYCCVTSSHRKHKFLHCCVACVGRCLLGSCLATR